MFDHCKSIYNIYKPQLIIINISARTKLYPKILNYPHLKPGKRKQLSWRPSKLYQIDIGFKNIESITIEV
jgi:hypothetical protein